MVILLAVVALAADYLLTWAENRLLKWRPPSFAEAVGAQTALLLLWDPAEQVASEIVGAEQVGDGDNAVLERQLDGW